jgi:hypothetical protein
MIPIPPWGNIRGLTETDESVLIRIMDHLEEFNEVAVPRYLDASELLDIRIVTKMQARHLLSTITPVQGRKILEQQQKIRNVCDSLKQCLVLLRKLQTLSERKQKVFHVGMSKCQEILMPLQGVKLLLWVDEHSHLLESICLGWGSEQIRSKEESKPKAK